VIGGGVCRVGDVVHATGTLEAQHCLLVTQVQVVQPWAQQAMQLMQQQGKADGVLPTFMPDKESIAWWAAHRHHQQANAAQLLSSNQPAAGTAVSVPDVDTGAAAARPAQLAATLLGTPTTADDGSTSTSDVSIPGLGKHDTMLLLLLLLLLIIIIIIVLMVAMIVINPSFPTSNMR
jgi:hypothetical protein